MRATSALSERCSNRTLRRTSEFGCARDQPVVDQAALLVAACVKIAQRLRAQVRDVGAKVFEVLLAQDVTLFAIRDAGP
jgi:hypothetical protein